MAIQKLISTQNINKTIKVRMKRHPTKMLMPTTAKLFLVPDAIRAEDLSGVNSTRGHLEFWWMLAGICWKTKLQSNAHDHNYKLNLMPKILASGKWNNGECLHRNLVSHDK